MDEPDLKSISRLHELMRDHALLPEQMSVAVGGAVAIITEHEARMSGATLQGLEYEALILGFASQFAMHHGFHCVGPHNNRYYLVDSGAPERQSCRNFTNPALAYTNLINQIMES